MEAICTNFRSLKEEMAVSVCAIVFGKKILITKHLKFNDIQLRVGVGYFSVA